MNGWVRRGLRPTTTAAVDCRPSTLPPLRLLLLLYAVEFDLSTYVVPGRACVSLACLISLYLYGRYSVEARTIAYPSLSQSTVSAGSLLTKSESGRRARGASLASGPPYLSSELLLTTRTASFEKRMLLGWGCVTAACLLHMQQGM